MVWILAIAALLFAGYELMTNAGNNGTTSGNSFIDALANAIANAEGANPANNNPGDLTTGDFNPANVVGTFNSAGVAIVDSIENGWSALYNKLGNILNGSSSVYSSSMTISEFAETYTGGDNAASWAQSVADQLGVTVDTTLADAQAIFTGSSDNGGQ
jgi:hypothetical protein